jgi:hypothetical protein
MNFIALINILCYHSLVSLEEICQGDNLTRYEEARVTSPNATCNICQIRSSERDLRVPVPFVVLESSLA